MPTGEKADYIVVGVGTAGALVAKELSDDKTTSVIALHNGTNETEDPLIKYSEFARIAVLDALIGIPFYETGESTRQMYADCRELLWVLSLPEGGASSVNVGAWCRGTDQFYREWEALAGPNWSPERVIEIYKSLENYHGRTPNPEARGYHGPIDVRQFPTITPLARKFTEAVHEGTGVPIVEDYNNPKTPIGASFQFQYTQKGCDGALRVSSATAFLNETVMTPKGRGVHGRKLRVKFECTALRTIWEGNKAIGVEYLQNGKVKKVYANKGVIVCAGLYSSPFLMHSGVGSKEMLEKLDIPVVFNNPNVGDNLIDQPAVLIVFSSDPKDTPLVNENNPFVQISWLPAPGGDPTVRRLRFSTTVAFPGVTAALLDNIQPKSRGRLTIDSADPLAPPVINFNVFENSADLELYVQAFQTYIKNINKALQAKDPKYQLLYPDVETIDDTDALIEFLKQAIQSNQSMQSHCQMAPLEQGGVVNDRGLVYGTQNLYVADDSIVPAGLNGAPPGGMDGSTMATAYLAAANITRLIKGE